MELPEYLKGKDRITEHPATDEEVGKEEESADPEGPTSDDKSPRPE
jgi:hypothetical protein